MTTTSLSTGALHRLKACKHGPMLYNVHDSVIGRSFDTYGEYSELEVGLVSQLVRPNDVVLDIGANIGALTIPLAKAVGAGGLVVAFEPQRVIHQLLCANVALSSLLNVMTLQRAVGAAPGTLRVPVPLWHQENNLGALALGEHAVGEPVEVMTLDQLDLPSCRLIKADVEGMEEQVLLGATTLLRTFRPFLYLECNPGERAASLIRTVQALRYRAYWHQPPYFNDNNHFGVAENLFPHLYSHNLLCVPEESPINMVGFSEAHP